MKAMFIGRLPARTLLVAVAAVLGGCAMVPPAPVVIGPVSAPPPAREQVAVVPNGAIFQPTMYGNYPLFEDRRPRNVGDIVTVVLEERINAAKSVATNTSRKGSGLLGIGSLPRVFGSGLMGQDFDASGENVANGNGSTNANNTFNGTITTTVIGVLPNGNLQVAGEKQIAINRGNEYVRFSGIVDPRSILGTNTVSSTQVADARIEYRTQGVLDEVQSMGWLQRFFLIASPF